MKIRRILLATFASMLMSQATFAVPAYPGVIKAKQADGTEISIRLHGDEHGNYRTTEDGRNSVSCITPYGMVQETLFLRPNPKERVRKQRVRLIP